MTKSVSDNELGELCKVSKLEPTTGELQLSDGDNEEVRGYGRQDDHVTQRCSSCGGDGDECSSDGDEVSGV
jgi:hypothetical protein